MRGALPFPPPLSQARFLKKAFPCPKMEVCGKKGTLLKKMNETSSFVATFPFSAKSGFCPHATFPSLSFLSVSFFTSICIPFPRLRRQKVFLVILLGPVQLPSSLSQKCCTNGVKRAGRKKGGGRQRKRGRRGLKRPPHWAW